MNRERIIKGWLKRKLKINLATLVVFLITGGNILAAGIEIDRDWINDDVVNFENTKDSEENISIVANDIQLSNNGYIISKYSEYDIVDGTTRRQKGNGLNIQEGILGVELNNNGIIKGEVDTSGGVVDTASKTALSYLNFSGNGISIYGLNAGSGEKVLDITNSGIISGKAKLSGGETVAIGGIPLVSRYGTGNGIGFYNSKRSTNIGNINNDGIIRGEADLLLKYAGVATYLNTHGSGISLYGDIADFLKGENIVNNGGISGKILAQGLDAISYSANGITFRNRGAVEIGKLENKGYFTGIIKSEGPIFYGALANSAIFSSGNGVMLTSGTSDINMENIENSGRILGEGVLVGRPENRAQGLNAGNGISLEGKNINIEEIQNIGTIGGALSINAKENASGDKSHENIEFSGSGISLNGDFTGNEINNKGVIKGTQGAISAKTIAGNVENFGIMAGRNIYSEGIELIQNNSTSVSQQDTVALLLKNENNQGIYIKLKSEEIAGIKTGKIEFDNDGDVIIEDIIIGRNLNGDLLGDNLSGKNILNIDKVEIFDSTFNIIGWDSYLSLTGSYEQKYENHIINGAGIKTGVLTVNDGVALTLADSIVNGYKTAVTLNENSSLSAKDTIFNGGGVKGEDAVIEVKGDSSLIEVLGNSAINGKVSIAGNNSTMSIGNGTMVNDDIIVSSGSDNTINLGDGSDEELRLFHRVDGFTTINTSGNVTAYETAKISTGDIHIKDGNFVVRIDGTDLDSEGRVKGHALYEHKGDIIIEVPTADTPMTYAQNHQGAQLVFKASGLGVGTVIAMEGTDITNLYDPQIGTYSIAHTAIKHLDENGNLTGDVEIALLNFDDIFIPENPSQPERDEKNEELEDIYDSIVKGDQLPSLAPTIDTENKTEEEARKGLLTLLDQVYANNPYVQSSKMSKENMDLFREEILSTKMPKKNEWIVEGHGVYSIDRYEKNRNISIGETSVSNKYSNEMITRGLLGTGEYGVDHNMSIGFGMGGSHQKLDMSKGSSLKGDAIYLGVFGKKKVNNYIFTAGLGYQHGKYDGNRILTNQYQTIRNTGDIKTEAWDIYGEMKYVIENSNGRRLEPKVRFSQSFIDQKSLSEKNGALAIDIENKRYLVPEIEIGMDLIEPIKVKSGKLEFKYGIGLAKTFGKNSNYTTAKIKDSTEFKVLGPDFNDTKLRLNGGLDYENSKGIFYNVALGVDITKDTKENINAKIGLGYKF